MLLPIVADYVGLHYAYTCLRCHVRSMGNAAVRATMYLTLPKIGPRIWITVTVKPKLMASFS